MYASSTVFFVNYLIKTLDFSKSISNLHCLETSLRLFYHRPNIPYGASDHQEILGEGSEYLESEISIFSYFLCLAKKPDRISRLQTRDQ